MFKKVNKAIAEPKKVLVYLIKSRLARILPDKSFLELKYWLVMGKKLNLATPVTFNEKLQWLKLHDHKARYTKLVDKYEVRKYIADTLGEEYLIPLLGVWDNFNDIDFDKLPNQFVLKCTHDSGGIVLCHDKSKLDIEAAKNKINKSLKRNYYFVHREWPYKNVKPRIIAEQYMVDDSGNDLKDFKILCFNGIAKCCFICLNRASEQGLNIDIYDMDWKPMPFERRTHQRSNTLIGKPVNFDRMVKYAEMLAADMSFVRIDFYEINKKLYFGEITLYPASGFEEFTPIEYDEILGNWLDLKR